MPMIRGRLNKKLTDLHIKTKAGVGVACRNRRFNANILEPEIRVEHQAVGVPTAGSCCILEAATIANVLVRCISALDESVARVHWTICKARK